MYAVHLTTAHWDAIVACHGIDADVQREAAATMAKSATDKYELGEGERVPEHLQQCGNVCDEPVDWYAVLKISFNENDPEPKLPGFTEPWGGPKFKDEARFKIPVSRVALSVLVAGAAALTNKYCIRSRYRWSSSSGT